MKKLSFFLIVVLIIVACNNSTSTDQTNTENTETTEATDTGVKVAEIKISGMHCASCENTIATVLDELDGVQAAKASVDMEIAKVSYDPAKVGPDDFKVAIEGKGYEVIECIIIEPEVNPTEPVK